MNDTRDISQNRQEDVYAQICTNAAFEEDADRWKDDGEDDLDNVAISSVSMCECTRSASSYMGATTFKSRYVTYLPVKGMAAVFAQVLFLVVFSERSVRIVLRDVREFASICLTKVRNKRKTSSYKECTCRFHPDVYVTAMHPWHGSRQGWETVTSEQNRF